MTMNDSADETTAAAEGCTAEPSPVPPPAAVRASVAPAGEAHQHNNDGEDEEEEREQENDDEKNVCNGGRHIVQRLYVKFCGGKQDDGSGGECSNTNASATDSHHDHGHLTLEECRRFYEQYFRMDDDDDDDGNNDDGDNDDDNDEVAEGGGKRNTNWGFGLLNRQNNNNNNNQKKITDKMKRKNHKKSRGNNWRIQKRSKKKKREELERQVESDIEDYIEWRTKCGLHLLYDGEDYDRHTTPLLLNDDEDSVRWNNAFEHGLRMMRATMTASSIDCESGNNSSNVLRQSSSLSLSSASSSKSSQVIFQHRTTKTSTEDTMMTDRDGYPIFHVLPARIYNDNDDDRHHLPVSRTMLHDPPYVYSIAFAAYLDMYIGRGGILSHCRRQVSHRLTNNNDDDEGDDHDFDPDYADRTMKRTVMFDVRPGKGWPNPPVLSMINMIRTIIETLQGNFPGRLHRLVIYPIPRPAMYIWNMIKFFFKKDQRIVDKIVLVPGHADHVDSPMPKDALSEWFDDDVLQYTEEFRTSLFVDDRE